MKYPKVQQPQNKEINSNFIEEGRKEDEVDPCRMPHHKSSMPTQGQINSPMHNKQVGE